MIGVVLAGGAGQRMGRPKPTVEIAGTPMAEFVAAALAAVCEEVVASGAEAAGLPVVPDHDDRHRGPLAGITSVLDEVGGPIVVVATDQPWVRIETLHGLKTRYAGLPVVPWDAGRRQVTCAIYPPSFSTVARDLSPGVSVQSILDEAPHVSVDDWSGWGEDGRSWFSVDSPADVDAGIARFGLPQLALP